MDGLINPQTGRPFTKDFFKDYAEGKPCLIRISSLCTGEPCAHQGTTVLCHITLAGLKSMGKKLIPDLLGAWGCGTCHDIVDGRRRVPEELATHEQIQLYHLEGMARTIDQLVKDGLLPNPI